MGLNSGLRTGRASVARRSRERRRASSGSASCAGSSGRLTLTATFLTAGRSDCRAA